MTTEESSRPLSRRAQYAESTREALLEAAHDLFLKDGYQNVGIDNIAKHARVTRGAFYHHFADKIALFDELVVKMQSDAVHRISTKASESDEPLKKFRLGVAAFMNVCSRPAYRKLVISYGPAVLGSERFREIELASVYGLMIGALTRLQREGLVKVPDPKVAAFILGAMVCESAKLIADASSPRQVENSTWNLMERVLNTLTRD